MRTKNATQLKARINARTKKADVPASLMQSYLFERLLKRLSKSKWRDNVAIKGGVLIYSLVGTAPKTTMDLDTTGTGFTLTHESAEKIFHEVYASADDNWTFGSTAPRTSRRPITIREYACTSRRCIRPWRFFSRLTSPREATSHLAPSPTTTRSCSMREASA